MTQKWLTNTSPGLERFWHPVAFVAEVAAERPHRVELLGRRFALVRNADGQVVAFDDECPHRRASLGTGCIIDGQLQCPYHGWRFDLDGTCVEIPALDSPNIPQRAHLHGPHGSAEHLGLVWIAVDEPVHPLPGWPEWHDVDWDTWYLERRTSVASAGLLGENFLDATHFAFVHRNTFGANSPSKGVERSERSGWDIVASYQQLTYQPGLGDVAATVTVSLSGPFNVHIVIASPTGSRSFTFFLQPSGAADTRLYLGIGSDDTGGDSAKIDAESVFNDRVYDEDLAILEDFADPRLPLDLRLEVHTSADSHLIAYRRMLIDIVDGLHATPDATTAITESATEFAR